VLDVEIPWLDDVVRAKRPQRLPVVLTRDEVRVLPQRIEGVPRLMAYLLYGSGLRDRRPGVGLAMDIPGHPHRY